MRAVILLFALGISACNSRTPTAPTPQPGPTVSSRPQLGGSYTLTLTPCELLPSPPPGQPDGNQVVSNFPIGPYRSIWTFTQQEDVVTGRFSASAPPAVTAGTLTARVDRSGRLVIENLRYQWSSSHVGTLQFSASGDAIADKTQISGIVSGEESWTSPFGVSRYTCSGARMPFRFTRSSTPLG